MYKGRKFKKAEKEFAKHSKSFDQFCAENNIEVEKPIESKPSKHKVWIGVASGVAAAAVVVCCFIPLMRQNTVDEHFYSDGDVLLDRIAYEEIDKDKVRLPHDDFMTEHSYVQRISPNGSDKVLGYNISNVVCYAVIDSTDYLYEIDYTVRIDRHYIFKGLALYDFCESEIKCDEINYKYSFTETDTKIGAYMTYAYNGYDYFIKFYENEYTTALSDESMEVFVKSAFGEGK